MIEIFTDGACRGNQYANNTGGWGFVIRDTDSDKERHSWGSKRNTTNNRMEMMAALKALRLIRNRPRSRVTVYSDSQLLIKGVTEWIDGWKEKGWRNAKKKPVENTDLWIALDELRQGHDLTWMHVNGHSGVVGNELADALATRGANGGAGSQDY